LIVFDWSCLCYKNVYIGLLVISSCSLLNVFEINYGLSDLLLCTDANYFSRDSPLNDNYVPVIFFVLLLGFEWIDERIILGLYFVSSTLGEARPIFGIMRGDSLVSS